ncbi:MAG: transglutaminase domain-containing protein [Chloroflexi bacterium]|nr:transglutaminase domain-containing protein [Chloroflexota bacterium]
MEKSPRWWDLPSAMLLFAATLFSAWRLQSTGWTEGLEHVRNLAVLGLLLGLALGQSRFQRRGVILLSIGYMLVFFTWQWLGFIEFSEEQTYLGERLLILFGRLATDLGEFFAGRAVADQLLVLALLSVPYWIAGLYSGYQLTRHANYLASILPGGILMLVVSIYHYTVKDYTWMFGVYLFIALLLLGRQKYLLDRQKWLKERVQVSSESNLDLNNTSIVIAAALVILAWGIPYTLASHAEAKEAWQNITGDWRLTDRLEDLFDSINKEKKPQPRNFKTELALGNQTSQSDLVVFLVYVPEVALEFPRLYWRGQIYDRFEENRWLTTGRDEVRHDSAFGDLEIPDTENRRRVSFTYDVYTDGQIILYSAAQPIWTNHDAIILHSKPAEDDGAMDVMALRASPRLEAGDLYRASAMLANPTIPELQAAGQEYPDWVKEKYLQLPEDFSPRIRDLAREITADSATPYDKAAAVTEYLRSEINYAPGITIPSEETDPLEYFLFERKQGFCNYYATAEVLILRAPAFRRGWRWDTPRASQIFKTASTPCANATCTPGPKCISPATAGSSSNRPGTRSRLTVRLNARSSPLSFRRPTIRSVNCRWRKTNSPRGNRMPRNVQPWYRPG